MLKKAVGSFIFGGLGISPDVFRGEATDYAQRYYA